ncbi:hypothetical protein BO1005MUT1_180259 [Hyphomicrobiales bacterium]|nr:hypothetical protein BO1005MUT1_180259 [Hyphomicrobiales bacterium]
MKLAFISCRWRGRDGFGPLLPRIQRRAAPAVKHDARLVWHALKNWYLRLFLAVDTVPANRDRTKPVIQRKRRGKRVSTRGEDRPHGGRDP